MTGEPSAFVLSVGMATAAGLVGCVAVMRGMTLASDAISHVALPGIGVALLLRVDPFLGAVAALVLGTVLVWAVESRARISTETVIGVVFSAALAGGAMFTPGESLIEALFGNPGAMSRFEIVVGLAGAAGVIAFMLVKRHQLVIALVSSDLARTAGIRVARVNLFYLLAFSIAVALGLRHLGVLLMGSLIIIPAATAKHLAWNLNSMLAIAVTIAIFSTVAGGALAQGIHREPGPVIIAIAAGMFFLSLLKAH